jgi:hypothetical protein
VPKSGIGEFLITANALSPHGDKGTTLHTIDKVVDTLKSCVLSLLLRDFERLTILIGRIPPHKLQFGISGLRVLLLQLNAVLLDVFASLS